MRRRWQQGWQQVGLTVATVLTTVACGAPPAAPGSVDPCAGEVPGFDHRTVTPAPGPPTVALHVAVGGPAGAPPVVLLHGFPETARTWRAVATDLAADHRVVVPDLRGVGCSSFAPPGTDAYDASSLAGDLAALATALDLGPATVVGHDMGAITAFAWARARPDQVAHLVLSGGGIPGYGLAELGPPHLATFAAPPGVVARSVDGDVRGFLTRFVGDPAVAASGSLDDAVRAYSAPGRLDAALGQYRGLARDAAVNRSEPRPLPMPVTTVEGGAPGISAATVAALAPRLTVVAVPGAGHYVQEDRPRETAAAVRDAAARP